MFENFKPPFDRDLIYTDMLTTLAVYQGSFIQDGKRQLERYWYDDPVSIVVFEDRYANPPHGFTIEKVDPDKES